MELSRISPVDPRAVWTNEARDLTPWLLANADVLADVMGIDLGRARGLVQQARVLAKSAQDQTGEAEALYHLAELSYASSLNNEAFAVALEARELWA